MKYLALIITSIFTLFEVNAQIKIYNYIDTALEWSNEFPLYKRLELIDTKFSNCMYYIRIHKDGQILDIWGNDSFEMEGLITNYIYKIETKKSSNNQRIISKKTTTYFSKTTINPDTSKLLFEKFKLIKKIPTDTLIKGWTHGFDGYSYYFEYKMKDSFTSKSYWCPDYQNDFIMEAKLVTRFMNSIDTLLNLQNSMNEFHSNLETGDYNNGGLYNLIITKKKPKELEFIKKNEPNFAYLDSINPFLNKYISDTLAKLIDYKKVLSHQYIYLDFSKTNKLVSVFINKTEGVSNKTIRITKREIRNTFKKINLDFVNSKIIYCKHLIIRENSILVKNTYFTLLPKN